MALGAGGERHSDCRNASMTASGAGCVRSRHMWRGQKGMIAEGSTDQDRRCHRNKRHSHQPKRCPTAVTEIQRRRRHRQKQQAQGEDITAARNRR